ncbi:MAG: nucleotidyl transferase AbiEii/AbiGii toxin family protein [Acidimicrobiia bacterium]
MVHPEKIQKLFAALNDENVQYILVGAVALDVLGIGRLTEDIDLFIDPSPANVERLRAALSRVWKDPGGLVRSEPGT